jgi:DNA-binding CsgD family transcriptional regulator
MQPNQLDVLSQLVASIYDCVIEPGRWPGTLAALCRAMTFRSAALNLRSLPSGGALLNVTSGIESPWLEMMADYSADIVAQWGGPARMLSLPPEEPALLSERNSEGLTEKNRFYAEWTKPRGIIDVMAVVLARDGATLGSIAFGRHRDAGAITAEETSLARLLIPHLQRSVAISRMLDLESVKTAMFERVIDALSVGVILTDTGLRLIHANTAALDMLARGVPVSAGRGSFSVSSPGATAALAMAVAKAATDETRLGRNGFGVPLRLGNGQTHVFHVFPLRSGQVRPGAMGAADAAVFIAPPRKSQPWPVTEVAALFDLTPAEARVFEGIASGASLSEVAAGSGAALSTIRTHLLQIFSQTGCHRQAELVALAASLKLPVVTHSTGNIGFSATNE